MVSGMALGVLFCIVLHIFQQWHAHQTEKYLREGARVRRVLFRGEAFAHKYRMWQLFYRETVITEERINVDY